MRAPYVPIVYGSIAHAILVDGKRPPTGECTHRWTVYLRHPDGLELGYAIEKVAFQLHATFPNPTRGT